MRNINSLLINADKIKNSKNEVYINPKSKYEAIYQSALECNGVKTIYLDNPLLFKDLYGSYIGDKK